MAILDILLAFLLIPVWVFLGFIVCLFCLWLYCLIFGI